MFLTHSVSLGDEWYVLESGRYVRSFDYGDDIVLITDSTVS